MQDRGETMNSIKNKKTQNYLLMLMVCFACFELIQCSPFTGPSTENTEDLLSLTILAGVNADCALVTQQAADDYKAEIYPVGTSGCNRTFIFGSSYNDYIRKEWLKMIQVETFLQETDSSACATTISTVQAVIADPPTNPTLVAQATIDSYIEYRVVDGPMQGRKTTADSLQNTAGLTSTLAATEGQELTRLSLGDFENSRYLALASIFSESEPACNAVVRVEVNRRLPGWIYNEKVDLEYANTPSDQIVPRFFLSQCFFGTVNMGDARECDNLQI